MKLVLPTDLSPINVHFIGFWMMISEFSESIVVCFVTLLDNENF